MLRIKLWGPAILATAALGVFTPAALGEANPESQGCNGNSIAGKNHEGPTESPSENPNASAGPGIKLGGEFPGSVSEAVKAARSTCP